MKNILTPQHLKTITVLLAVFGLVIDFYPYFNTDDWSETSFTIYANLNLINLPYYPLRFLEFFRMGMPVNVLSVLFHLLLLAGGLLFWRSGEKETRLIRFCYAVIFLMAVVSAFRLIINTFTHPPTSGLMIAIYVFAVIKTTALGYLSWFGTRMLASMKSLKVVVSNETTQPVEASRWHRFFHLVVDTGLAGVLLGSTIIYYLGDFLQKVEQGPGERAALFLLLLIARMIYYPLFEGLFGATPAKMFSESRVVKADNTPITVDLAIPRTFSRFVPFEAFSFLGDGGGWHDRWSNTYVVKENRVGVKGIRYLIVVPIVIVLGVLSYVGKELYDDYRDRLAAEERHYHNVAVIEDGLKAISTETVIEFSSSRYNTIYLKPEVIEGDKLFCSKFTSPGGSIPYTIGEFYKTNQYSFEKVTISLRDLSMSYQKEYDRELPTGRKLHLDTDEVYEIERMFQLDVPFIGGSTSAYFGHGELSFNIENCGWAGTIKAVKTIAGNFTFVTPAPLPYFVTPPSHPYSCSSFSFTCAEYDRGEPYSFEFIITDNAGKDHRFQVDGTDLDRTVRKIN